MYLFIICHLLFLFFLAKVKLATNIEELQAVFVHDQDSYAALQENGFHQAISMINFDSKDVILGYLTDYHFS